MASPRVYRVEGHQMTAAASGSQDWWSEQLGPRLQELREGHRHARASHEKIVRVLTVKIAETTADSVKHELRVMALIATLVYELKTLILRLIEAPADRVIWHKYLALALWQVLDELPRQLGPGLKAEAKVFRESVRELRKDRAFMDELGVIRNSVAAHLSQPSEVPGLVEWSIDSIVSQAPETHVMNTQLVVYALIASAAVHELGSSILRRYPEVFPGATT